jgi:long-subunit fatty acid transport protein
MKTKPLFLLSILFFLTLNGAVFSQINNSDNTKSDFWKDVQFGGGLGIGIGNNFTNIAVAPSAIYNFNQYVSAGLGLQYSYLKQKNFYSAHTYGASIIGLVNPIEEIQLSVELEQLRVNVNYENINYKENFWNTGLFLGAGYRTNNVTIGARYNVLFDKDRNVYGDAFMPFVRVYF